MGALQVSVTKFAQQNTPHSAMLASCLAPRVRDRHRRTATRACDVTLPGGRAQQARSVTASPGGVGALQVSVTKLA